MQYGYGISISPHRTVTDEGYLLVKDCSIATLGGRRYAAPGIAAGQAGRFRLGHGL